jgi:hypothetical protein
MLRTQGRPAMAPPQLPAEAQPRVIFRPAGRMKRFQSGGVIANPDMPLPPDAFVGDDGNVRIPFGSPGLNPLVTPTTAPPDPLNTTTTAPATPPPPVPPGATAPTTTYQPGPKVQRFQKLENQVQGLDENGQPIIDPNTGKPVQSPLAANPSWWRSALAAGAEFMGGRKHPGAGQAVANAIISGDPKIQAAQSLRAKVGAAKSAADEERLNEQMQWHKQYQDQWNQTRLENAQSRAQQEQDAARRAIIGAGGRPIPGVIPSMPPPSEVNGGPMTVSNALGAQGSGEMTAPPTVSGGIRPISPAIRAAMPAPTLPVAPGPEPGWTPARNQGQNFEVPPADVAAQMKQEAIQKTWPVVTQDMADTLGGDLKVGQPIDPRELPGIMTRYQAAKQGPKPPKEPRPVSVAPGHSLYDPDAGKVVWTAPQAPEKPPKPAGPATFRSIEAKKQGALQKAESQAQQDLELYGGADRAPAPEKQRIYSELESKKAQIQAGYEAEIEAAGGSVPQTPPGPTTPAPPPAGRANGSTAQPKIFPQARLADFAKQNGVSTQQAKTRLQAEGYQVQ